MLFILTISMRAPVPMVSISPTVMFEFAATLMMASPAFAASDRVVSVAALPTSVTVANSIDSYLLVNLKTGSICYWQVG